VHERIISAVKRVHLLSDRMSCRILRGQWCHIVLKIDGPTEDETDYVKDSFFEELDRVFNKFPKHHVKILLGDSMPK
jgi:hypothetical protein